MSGLVRIFWKCRQIDFQKTDEAYDEGNHRSDAGCDDGRPLSINFRNHIGKEEGNPTNEEAAIHPDEAGTETKRLHAKKIHHHRNDAIEAGKCQQPFTPIQFKLLHNG